MMTSLLEREGVEQVQRARPARNRQVGIVSERLVTGQDERGEAPIGSRQRGTADAECGELVDSRALRRVVAVERIQAESHFIEHAWSDRLGKTDSNVLPAIEHGHAEARKISGTYGKRQVARIATEAVADAE